MPNDTSLKRERNRRRDWVWTSSQKNSKSFLSHFVEDTWSFISSRWIHSCLRLDGRPFFGHNIIMSQNSPFSLFGKLVFTVVQNEIKKRDAFFSRQYFSICQNLPFQLRCTIDRGREDVTILFCVQVSIERSFSMKSIIFYIHSLPGLLFCPDWFHWTISWIQNQLNENLQMKWIRNSSSLGCIYYCLWLSV